MARIKSSAQYMVQCSSLFQKRKNTCGSRQVFPGHDVYNVTSVVDARVHATNISQEVDKTRNVAVAWDNSLVNEAVVAWLDMQHASDHVTSRILHSNCHHHWILPDSLHEALEFSFKEKAMDNIKTNNLSCIFQCNFNVSIIPDFFFFWKLKPKPSEHVRRFVGTINFVNHVTAM